MEVVPDEFPTVTAATGDLVPSFPPVPRSKVRPFFRPIDTREVVAGVAAYVRVYAIAPRCLRSFYRTDVPRRG